MDIAWFFFIFFCLSLVVTLKDGLLHLFWWQIKEYRLDRMMVHLKTNEGQKLFLGPVVFVKVFILIELLINPFIGYPLFMLLYGVLALKLTKEVLQKKLLLPKWSLRIWQTLILMLVVNVLLFKRIERVSIDAYLAILMLDNLIPITAAATTLLMGALLKIYKFRVAKLAQQKIAAMENLTVVGITGSFGKTSTKEFLRQILENKFLCLATPGHVNTEMGVAQFILKSLTPKHQILIVEMGAYKLGEIKALCKIVKPQIGILTAISSQHLSLFGKVENIIKTKFELIESLPQNGLAILNADNDYIVKNASQYHVKKIFYSARNKRDIYATNIKIQPQNLSFDVHIEGQKQHILSNLLGRQNVPNLLAAFVVCFDLGISLKEISRAALKLTPAEGTMEVLKSGAGATLIDDTYNINPEGVKAALDFLLVFKGMKKVAVLSPMIELGNETKKSYEEVLKQAQEIVDKLVWIGQGFKDATAALKAVKDLNKKDVVILFEGRNTKAVLEALK